MQTTSSPMKVQPSLTSKRTSSFSNETKKPRQSLSIVQKLSTETTEETDVSASIQEPEPEIIKINYQDVVVNIFYQSMLDLVVDSWTPYPEESPRADVETKEIEKTESKDFKNLLDADLHSSQVVSVEGSQVNLVNLESKPKSSVVLPKLSSEENGHNKNSNSTTRIFIKNESFEHVKQSILASPEHSEANLLGFRPSAVHFPASCAGSTTDDETVSIVFKSGGVYQGPTLKKCMHGYGKYYFSDGAYYEGEFKHGEMTGKGLLVLPDLSIYFGDFCGGWFHGKGTMRIASTSMIYSGSWRVGRKCGEGWILYKQGNWYDGEWLDDRRHGMGLRQYDYGIRYKGMYCKGLRSGDGSMIYSNNDYYQGEWFEGRPHGFGEYTWNVQCNDELCFMVSNTYKGAWLNGMRHGAGIMNFGLNSGATMAGIWNRNMKHGAGVILCGNGNVLELNPLFQHDKPLHTEVDYSNVASKSDTNVYHAANSECKITLQRYISTDLALNRDFLKKSIQRITQSLDLQSLESLDPLLNFSAIFQQKRTSISEVVHLDYKDFPNPEVQCSPMDIPIHAVPQSLNLSYFINLISVTCKSYCDWKNIFRKDSDSDVVEPETTIVGDLDRITICPCSMKISLLRRTQLCKYLNDIPFTSECDYIQFEDSKLRTVILGNFSTILNIYDFYARLTVATNKDLNYKPVLVRLFLWQMYRDIGLLEMGYSLHELDVVCADNPDCGYETDHEPFETIYLWQFIHVLLAVGIHVSKFMKLVDQSRGEAVLATIFKSFLLDQIVPNMGKRKYAPREENNSQGQCLFEYKNLLPINSVLALFKSYGYCYTVRNFLNDACVKRRESILCYLKSYADEGLAKIQNGVNVVFFGYQPIFIPEDQPLFRYPDQPPPPEDPYFKTLYVFRSLGPKRILNCIHSVCPAVKKDGVIVNMQYPLTFIEFYDILLTCAHTMIDREMKRLARQKRREEIRLLMEQGLWEPPEDKEKKGKGKSGEKKGKKKRKS